MAAATRMDHGGMGSPLGDASGIEVSPAADAERESGGKGGDTSLQVSPLEAAVSPDAGRVPLAWCLQSRAQQMLV